MTKYFKQEGNVMEKREIRLTVGEFRELLDQFPEDTEIAFSCLLDPRPLEFHRLRGDKEHGLRIELREAASDAPCPPRKCRIYPFLVKENTGEETPLH